MMSSAVSRRRRGSANDPRATLKPWALLREERLEDTVNIDVRWSEPSMGNRNVAITLVRWLTRSQYKLLMPRIEFSSEYRQRLSGSVHLLSSDKSGSMG